MKRWILALTSALAGAVVASLVWGWILIDLQIEYAAGVTTSLHGSATAGERMLRHLDHPEPDQAHRVAFMASNMVSSFSVGLDMAQKRWPYLDIKRGYESESKRLQQFLHERQAKLSVTNEAQDGAAHGSQMIRSKTNATSGAAGSHR